VSLPEPVAKTVRGNDVEHLPRDIAVLLDVEVGELLVETIGPELCEQRIEVLDMESATVLSGIATVLGKSDLDIVAGKYG